MQREKTTRTVLPGNHHEFRSIIHSMPSVLATLSLARAVSDAKP
jgi:hypothetical protein